MRYLILFFFLIPLLASGQRNKNSKNQKENLKYYEEIFGEYEKQFDVFEAPEKWKDEPLVLLCQKTHISFLRDTKSGFNRTKGVVRRRFLIQDKSEIETFSEFYFQDSDIIGINHIKPNGDERRIETENAIKVESNVPDFYSDSYHFSEYNKIAIPDLQVGDIIDYFKVFTQGYPGLIQVIAPIDYTYPVLSQELIFDVDKLWTFYYDTFNDAPNFKTDPKGGRDNSGRKRKSVKRFVLKDKDRPAREAEKWAYRNLESPLVKFTAVTSYSGYFDKKAQHRDLDINRVMELNLNIKNEPINLLTSNCIRVAKKCNVDKLRTDDEKVNLLYRLLRYQSVAKQLYADGYLRSASYSVGALEELSHDNFELIEYIFSNVFVKLLKKFDIPAEYVAVVPQSFGGIDKVVNPKEVTFGVYVPSTKKYYWTNTNYNVAGEEVKYLMGAEGYRIGSKRSKRSSNSKKITVPVSTSDKNVKTISMNVEVNSDNSINVKETISFTGMYKQIYNPLFLFHSSYGKQDIVDFETNKFLDKVIAYEQQGFFSSKAKLKDKKAKELIERFEEIEDNHQEGLNSWISSEYKADSMNNYEVIEYGVTEKEPVLKTSFDFESEEYVKKAGPNLIFELGALIGDQEELDKEEMENRIGDIYFDFPKEISNEIVVNLPDGLQANGLDALNVTVDNANGSFKTTASQSGNKVTVETRLVFKNYHAPASEWPTYVELLEAVYDFSQQKVVLKK